MEGSADLRPRGLGGAATGAVAGVDQGRYFDALLAEMDRGIRPELVSGKSQFTYAALRRIFVRLIVQNAGVAAFGELGRAATGEALGSLTRAELEAAARREAALLERIEAAVDDRLAQVDEPGRGADRVDARMLQRYLRGHGHDAAKVTAFRVLAGGRSKQTVLFEAAGLAGLPADLVIRRDLNVGATGTTVADEFNLLRALADRGAPVPRPYLLEQDAIHLGMPFMVMQRMPGALRGDIMTAPDSAAAVLDSARVLGALHALPVAGLGVAFPGHGGGAGPSLLEEVITLRDGWNAAARDESATIALAFRWLAEQARSIPSNQTVVHGDYNFHNLLYDGDVLTAVLDWELGHLGHPAEDLGYIQSVASTVVPWDRFLAAYVDAGGPPADPVVVAFYAMLGSLRLLALLHKARFAFESALTDDLHLAEVVLFHLPKFVQKLSLELQRALALTA